MEFTGRYFVILIWLFVALTGSAQNMRVTSLTAVSGGGGITNGGPLNLLRISGPTTAFTATLGAAGNLNGDYTWYVTYLTAQGETDTASTATESPASQRVTLSSIPTGPTGVTARRLYRTSGVDPQTLYFLTTLNDNTTTTYEDNTADGSLTGPLLSTLPDNTAGGDIYINGARVFHASTNSAGGNLYVGYGVGVSNKGHWTIAGGFNALRNATNTLSVTAWGYETLRELLQGDAITAIGDGALRFLRADGNFNTAEGVDALGSLTNGPGNTAQGRDALFNLRTGTNNTGVGHFAGEDLRRGSNNMVLGAYTTFTWDTNNNSFSVGAFAEIPTNSVGVFGGAPLFARQTNFYFGPHIHATPSPVILNSPSGSGADVTGGDFSIAAGQGTGNRSGGVIRFLTSGSGASGSGLNALVERAQVNSNGLMVSGMTVSNFSRWLPQTNTLAGSGSTNLTIDTTQAYLVRCTPGANFALLFTNVLDGAEGVVEMKQDGTGNRLITLPYSNGVGAGGAAFTNVYFGKGAAATFTGITLSTNSGYVDEIKWRARGTNVMIVGFSGGHDLP